MLRTEVLSQIRIQPLLGAVSENLGVPTVLQVRKFWCWAACMAMVQKFNGNDGEVCAVASMFLNADCCIQPINGDVCDKAMEQSLIKDQWGELGHTAELVDNALEFEELKVAISEEKVIQAAQFFFTGNGHVVLITGWQSDDDGVNWVLVDDPYDGEALVKYSDLKFGYKNSTWLWSWVIKARL